MKIALFSDIHANLPALEAFFESMDSKKPDFVYCLGDLVGYNIWPNEVIHEIRKRNIPTIAGNYDQGVGLAGDDCGCAYKTDHDKSNGEESIAYTNRVVKTEERNYLRNLASHIRLEYNLTSEKFNLLMVHGSPRKINEYLFVDREEKSFLRILGQAVAHIMVFGHTHKPFHRIFKDNSRNYRHAINIGSVGKPKDGDPRGCYAILALDESFALNKSDSLNVEFVRFEYDVEKAARAVEESPLPNDFADMLRKGY
ncbi:MAG: metallophosphoesterase family protein [Cyclobacteriaceae bacterium]